MIALLHHFSLRYALKHPFRVFLSAMAVTLGVALYVSSDVSNYSTEMAFAASGEKLKGGTQLQVTRGHLIGVEMDALKKVDALGGIKAAPMLQLSTTLTDYPGEGTALTLGVDFQREMGFRRWNTTETAEGGKPEPVNPVAFAMGAGAVITRSFADKHGLKVNSPLRIETAQGTQKLTIGAILSDEGPAQVFGGKVIVMQLGAAQRLFNREGRCDRIELVVDGDVKEARERVSATLGPDYLVEPPPQRNALLDDAMGRVKALMGISAVAVLVAIFIIYNSVSISVVERIKEIGTLRAFGATRAQIFGTILLEWSVIGVVGSVAGLAGGFWLASALIVRTAAEVNRMIPIVSLDHASLPARALIGAPLLGIVTTLAAAWFPARAAMSVSPIELMRQGLYRIRMIKGYHKMFWVGASLIVGSTVVWWGWVSFKYAGLASALLGFFGDALVLPQLCIWIARASRPMMRRYRVEAFLAADNTAKFPQRTALTVIALAGALAMMVSASAIVKSFKVHAEGWLTESLPFDLSISSTDMSKSLFSTSTFPEELGPEIDKIDGVDFTYGVRVALQDYGERTVMIVAPELDQFDRMHRLRSHKPYIPDEALPELMAGHGVAVSKNFAALHGLKVGDSLELKALDGIQSFKILGLREDYSWPQGAIFMDRSVFKERWKDSGLTYLDIKFLEGADEAAIKTKIEEKLRGNYTLFMHDVRDLLKISDDTLSQTLKFTNIQVAVAMVIGFLGIVNTLLISVMQRMREVGLLRAVGMTRGQVVWMVVVESVFLATLAGALGVGLGLLGARWPLAIHVFQLSGFLMPLCVPWDSIALALGGAIVIGFLASFVPARHASRVNLLDAIGYE